MTVKWLWIVILVVAVTAIGALGVAVVGLVRSFPLTADSPSRVGQFRLEQVDGQLFWNGAIINGGARSSPPGSLAVFESDGLTLSGSDQLVMQNGTLAAGGRVAARGFVSV